MKCPYVAKVCSKCKRILVASIINFNRQKGGLYGLTSSCKDCIHIYRMKNKQRDLEYQKKYREKNKERISERDKKYREENKEHYKEWRDKHKEERKEYDKKYREENPHIRFNGHHRRKQEKENGKGITKEQWLEMMEFFNWKCAYSGIELNKDNRNVDHIIPLSKNGEHEIWNCVPMYNSYNFSKKDKDMLDWYVQQNFFLEERLNKIYEWIKYAKNKWDKNEFSE